MKVLFFSRGKLEGQISPVVRAQASSIEKLIDLTTFPLMGKGWLAYLKGVGGLKKYMRKNSVDLVHAHYSYIGMIASLATRKPIVVSLMGSDIEDFRFGRMLIRLFAKFNWKMVIVKSQRSKDHIGLNKAHVIPNGVNLEIFSAAAYEEARQQLGFEKEKKYVLFLSHPDRKEKNYRLATSACKLLASSINTELLALHNISHEEVSLYLSAADALLLTSFFEGSPNAVKEAMACNCPIVSTDVGDVKEVIRDTEGCYITSFKPEDVAAKLKLALDFGKRTKGRERIQHLDSKVIAEKLINIYKEMLH